MDFVIPSYRPLGKENVVADVYAVSIAAKTNYPLVTNLSCFPEIIFGATLFQGMQGE